MGSLNRIVQMRPCHGDPIASAGDFEIHPSRTIFDILSKKGLTIVSCPDIKFPNRISQIIAEDPFTGYPRRVGVEVSSHDLP